jgi:hypothetical protein
VVEVAVAALSPELLSGTAEVPTCEPLVQSCAEDVGPHSAKVTEPCGFPALAVPDTVAVSLTGVPGDTLELEGADATVGVTPPTLKHPSVFMSLVGK